MNRAGRCIRVSVLGTAFTALACTSALHLPAVIDVIPFRLIHGLIVVPVYIRDAGPFPFVLDTGADPSVVSTEIVRMMRLRVTPRSYPGFGVGRQALTVRGTVLPGVRVGQIRSRWVRAAVVDMTRWTMATGVSVHGALGYDWLRHRIVQIDYAERILRVLRYRPRHERLAPGRRRVVVMRFRLARYPRMPVVRELRIQGRTLPAGIDTGSNLTFVVRRDRLRARGIPVFMQEREPQTVYGYRGKAVLYRARLADCAFGPFFWRLLDVYVVDPEHDPRPGSRERVVTIGNGFLSRFRVTLDYPERTLVLARGEDAASGLGISPPQ